MFIYILVYIEFRLMVNHEVVRNRINTYITPLYRENRFRFTAATSAVHSY